MAKGLDRGGLSQSLSPLLRRFQKFGDEAGREIAARVGKGATKAKGDMFGLAGAVGEVEKRSRRASKAAKGLEHDMFGVNRTARDSGRSIKSASAQLGDWASGARGAGGASRRLSDQLRGLGAELRKAGRDARRAGGGFGGFDGGIARVNRGFSFFRNILRTLKWPLLIAGLGLATQGLSALAAGAVATTSALGPLAAALVTLPAAATLAAQAFGALKLATAGVGDAVKAALDAEVQSGTQAVDVLRQQEDAAEGVAHAKRNLMSVQRQAKLAQEDLTQAREEARRELEDMRLSADESRDSEQGAVLQLRQAQAELRRTLADPKASGLDIRFAEEAVDQARNDLERTRIDAKRARRDYRDAQKAGVEGMPQVVAAERAKEDAKRAVEDAERDLARAVRDSTAAMEEQGAAASAFHEKMSQLPPAAQKFVRVLVGLKPRLDALRDTAAAGFFPGAERGLRAVLKNFGPVRGIVDETSRAFGRLAERAGMQFGSEEWGRDLRKIGRTNTKTLDRMGEAGLNLANAFRHILVAARPFLDWLSESTRQLSEWIEGEAEAGRKSGRLAEFFDRTRTTMELLGPILKGVGGALLNIGEAARPLGNEILKALGGSAEGWRKWSDSIAGKNDLKQYFTEAKPAIFEMGKLIGAAGKAFFELGRQRGVAHLLRLVRTELIPALTDVAGAFTGWASDFLRDFGRLRKEGVPTFEAFLQVLAEKAGEAGWKIAKALANTFINASIWGKLAVGGWLLYKFGGLSAFAKMGGRAGASLGKSLFKSAAAWIAGTQTGASLLGWFQGAFSRNGRFGKAFSTAGTRMGKLLGRGLVVGVIVGFATLAPWIAQEIQKRVLDPIEDKINGFLNDIVPFGDPFGEGGPRISGRGLEARGLSAGEINRSLGWDAFEIPAPKTDKAERGFREFGKAVGRISNQARTGFREHIDRLPGIAERSGRGINSQMLPRLDHLADEGGAKGRKFAGRVGGSFGSVAGAAQNAMGNIGDNVREALKALNVGKVPKFNLKKLVQELPQLPPLERQRGGPINMGAPFGDSVPAILERGEYVLNRKAVKRVGKSQLDAINFGMAPRFQTGGFAELRPPARALAQELAAQGFVPTSTYRPTSTTYHGTREAIDYGDSVNNMGRLWAVLRPKVARLAELFGPSRLPGATLWKHGSPFSDAGLQAGHEDHIHTAITGMVGAIGRALAKVPRMMLQGPDGPLKNLGQAAVDRVRKAANSFIDEKTVMGSLGHGSGQAAGSAQLRDWLTTALKLTGHFSPANLTALIGRALQESGGNPRAINLWDCLPERTLILTRRGWLVRDEVEVGDETIGYNPETGRSEWTPVTRVVKYADADTVRVGNKRWAVEATPNHRWVVDNRTHGIEMRETDDLGSRDSILLAALAETGEGLDITKGEAALLGWIAGDGHVEQRVDKPRARKKPSMTVAQSKREHFPAIEEALADAPHARYEYPERTSCVTWRLDSEYSADLLTRAGDPKDDAVAQVTAMSPTQRQAWLGAIRAAEGNADGLIFQCEGPVCDAIKLALYLEGHRPSQSKLPGKDQWAPCHALAGCRPRISSYHRVIEEAGPQDVWCVSTELGTWTAQQDGQVFLTGNSNAEAGIPSKGLLQTIDPTFNAYKMKGLGDIWNPVHNAVAAIRYMMDRYGHIVGPGPGGYASGGLVEAMQLGGLLGLQGGGQAKGGKAGKRKYAPMQRHLERFKELGLGGANIPEFTRSRIQRLAGLSGSAEVFSEWASNASSLTIEGQDGNTIQGEFQGGTEGHWLLQQLQALGSLRNELIAAHEVLAKAKEHAEKLIQQAQRQLESLRRQISDGQRQRNKILDNLVAARHALSNARDDKDPDRRRSRMERARQTIAKLGEQLVHVDFRQSQRRALAGEIKGKTLPSLGERLTGVSDVLTGTMGGGEGFIGLEQVQGLSGPMHQIGTYGVSSPAIGVLGGEILNAQSRLRAIDEQKTTSADAGDSTEREGLVEELLRQEQQRRVVSDAHGVVLEGWDDLRQGIMGNFAGFFAKGGSIPAGKWGWAGERGPEPVIGPGTIVSNPDARSIFAAGDVQGVSSGVNVEVLGQITTASPSEPAIRVRDGHGEIIEEVFASRGVGRQHPSSSAFRVNRR